jgi:poly(A) polymerase
MIGDAATRYREDPLRILRVVRFAAMLGFSIEPGTQQPIARAIPMLAAIPASRLFDEMFKLLQTGHSLASLEQLRRQGLHRGVFPVLDAVFADAAEPSERMKFIELALVDTDKRVAEGRAVAPSFLLTCLLWHEVQSRWAALQAQGEVPFQALQTAIDAVFDARIGDISGRGKLAGDMREIWLMQPRFERRTGPSARALVAQPRFRAGYDFLRLRADAGQADSALADWWEDYYYGDEDEREALVQAVRPSPQVRRVPAARRAAPTGAAAPDADPAIGESGAPGAVTEAESESSDEAGAKRRRRRRRRRPGAGATAADAAGDVQSS